jgi:hypothetical protein
MCASRSGAVQGGVGRPHPASIERVEVGEGGQGRFEERVVTLGVEQQIGEGFAARAGRQVDEAAMRLGVVAAQCCSADARLYSRSLTSASPTQINDPLTTSVNGFLRTSDRTTMLDTLFWISVVVASSCGALMTGIDLYDEWADAARNVDETTGMSPTDQLRRFAMGIENAPQRLDRVG